MKDRTEIGNVLPMGLIGLLLDLVGYSLMGLPSELLSSRVDNFSRYSTSWAGLDKEQFRLRSKIAKKTEEEAVTIIPVEISIYKKLIIGFREFRVNQLGVRFHKWIVLTFFFLVFLGNNFLAKILFGELEDVLGLVTNNFFRIMFQNNWKIFWNINLFGTIDSLFGNIRHSFY